MSLNLKSPEFKHGAPIPQRYARDGRNLSPPLRWDGAPNGTRSFALVVEDPDAPNGMFHHWAVYDLSAETTQLEEGADRSMAVVFGRAINDFGNTGYDGPQPPAGDAPHHYHFRLAALDVDHLDVPPDASVEAVWSAAEPHIIDRGELIGTFQQN